MKILGIGGQGYRDSSAALIVDGQLLAAASEERFTRIKHDGGYPRNAVAYCLGRGGVELEDVDRIAIANNPWLNLRDKLTEWYGEGFLESSRFQTYHIFHDELHAAVRYLSALEGVRNGDDERLTVVRHHLCHMAEAFWLSPFSEAAVLSIDGRGEISTSSQGMGRGGEIEVFSVEEMPNSIGLLCAAVANYLGFREEDDEFRIMSISSLGTSRYLEAFRQILRPAPDGTYVLNEEYFDSFEGRAFLSERFERDLGPRRSPGDRVTERHADLAASLQTVVEEVALHMAAHLRERTGAENLCLAGGVAQNWVLGGRIRADGPFANVHTGFAPGDEGTAIGAALTVHMAQDGSSFSPGRVASDLGPSYPLGAVLADLNRVGLTPEKTADPVADAADRIARGRLVAWFEGNMEYGPRALGHRSILVDPTSSEAKERLVASVKPRARYHPFGIAVREEDVGRYFADTRPDPNMASHRKVLPEAAEALAPVLHTDGTARVQTVSASAAGSLAKLLAAVGERTGHPVLLNTSLNTPGRPLARTTLDAVETFYTSGLDDLFLEGARLTKQED